MYYKRDTHLIHVIDRYGRTSFAIIQMIADLVTCITLSALIVVYHAYAQEDYYRYIHVNLYVWTTLLTTIALIFSFSYCGIYNPLRAVPPAEVVAMTARRLLVVMLLLMGCLFLLKISDSFSRLWLVGWGSASMVGLCGLRLIARHAERRLVLGGRLTKNVAIVGANNVGRRLAARLAQDFVGIHVVGMFDQAPSQAIDQPRFRAIDALDELASVGRVDEIIITVPASDGKRIAELCRRFHPFSVSLRVLAPEGFEHFRILENVRYGEISTFLIIRKPLDEVAAIVKWLEDKVIALFCLISFLPLMLLVALAIKLDTPGPILFRQKRLGANNRPFNLLKFRSMYVDETDPLGQRLTHAGDPRVTGVGRLLRISSLDELPQLINVLRGDMSLVGPRPHPLAAKAGGVPYVDAVEDYPLRHRVKPGITGWAQVNGWRGETTRIEQLKGRVECDLYYVENWSLWFDLVILSRTLFTVLSRQNAV